MPPFVWYGVGLHREESFPAGLRTVIYEPIPIKLYEDVPKDGQWRRPMECVAWVADPGLRCSIGGGHESRPGDGAECFRVRV